MSDYVPILTVEQWNDKVSFNIAPIDPEEVLDEVLQIHSADVSVPPDVSTQIRKNELPEVYITIGVSFGCNPETYYYTTYLKDKLLPCISFYTHILEYNDDHDQIFCPGLLGIMEYQCMIFRVDYVKEDLNPQNLRFYVTIEFKTPDLVLYNKLPLVYYDPCDGPSTLSE